MNTKFKVGDKVKVCNDLITTIRMVDETDDICAYWFNDENGGLKFEYEQAIELYDEN